MFCTLKAEKIILLRIKDRRRRSSQKDRDKIFLHRFFKRQNLSDQSFDQNVFNDAAAVVVVVVAAASVVVVAAVVVDVDVVVVAVVAAADAVASSCNSDVTFSSLDKLGFWKIV